MKPVVSPGDPTEPQAAALLAASHALMQDLFPADSNHYLPIDALTAPEIVFFVARSGTRTLGCGALADRGAYGEIKSMFVDPAARGTGTGAALLIRIEQAARARALPLLRLETGHSLHAAQRLYQRHGFAPCAAFGDYPDDPLSLFMEKPLT